MMQQSLKKSAKKKATSAEHHVPEVLEVLDNEAKREWKNAIRFKNENNWLFTGFVMLIAALVIINTIYVVQSSNQTPESSSNAKIQNVGKILNSLQQAQTNDVTVFIGNVSENDSTDPAFTFSDTETMLIFDITFKNNTAAIQHIIPSSQLFIHDRDGGLYPIHASSFVTNPLAAQDILPDQSVTGQVSFVIPKRQTQPLLFVDMGWSSQVPIVFDVLH